LNALVTQAAGCGLADRVAVAECGGDVVAPVVGAVVPGGLVIVGVAVVGAAGVVVDEDPPPPPQAATASSRPRLSAPRLARAEYGVRTAWGPGPAAGPGPGTLRTVKPRPSALG
jgi:hypothetical protein